jgi:hypothetical protein
MTDQTQQSSSGAGSESGQSQSGATSGAGSQTTSDATRAAEAARQSAQSATTNQRPDGIPDDLWDNEKGLRADVLTQRLKEADDLKAEREARKAAVPPDPKGYKRELSEDVRKALPPNTEIAAEDPMWDRLAEFGHKKGWTQDDYRDAAGQWIAAVTAQRQADAAATEAAVTRHQEAIHKALGDNGPEQVESLKTWMKALFGPKVGEQFQHSLFTPDIIRGWQQIQEQLTSQGVTTFSQAGREGAAEEKIASRGDLTFAQKWSQARGAQPNGHA